MRISFGKMCRGDGIAYIETIVRSNQRYAHARFSACSEDGISLPIESYRYQAIGTYVLATPLLDTKKIIIQCALYDDDDGVIAKTEKSISRTLIKWSSRLNYRLDFETVSSLRDINDYTYSDQIHIRLSTFVKSVEKRQYIVKGYVCAPIDASGLSLSLLDNKGCKVESVDIVFGRASSTVALGLQRTEVDFTLRIPLDCVSYCLLATAENFSRSGFVCFDQCSIDLFSDRYNPLFYRCSDPVLYDRSVERRKRFSQGVKREDLVRTGDNKFSIVVPLFHTPARFFDEMIRSVQGQLYTNWELLLVNATPEDQPLCAALEALQDSRIKVITLEGNLGIAENTNVGIEAASGDYIVLFDHDDVLDERVLLEYAKAIEVDSQIDVLYCDEDFLTESGTYVAPHFKSDLNIDLLRCHNYITHLLAVKSNLAKSLKLRKEFDGAQDYDFVLRLSELTNRFHHVSDVLYHWRISDTSTAKDAGNKSYATLAGQKALQQHLDRMGIRATARETSQSCFYRVEYSVSGQPKVSIIIPNKDCAEVLMRCIDSIEEKTTYSNFDIYIVENNSTEAATFDCYQQLTSKYSNITLLNWDKEFNYSAINNFGVDQADGDYILFLNNDTEVIVGNWIESMLSICQREDVGAVGAKLLYPDNTVQHAGVLMITCQSANDLAGPIHVFNNIDADDPGYMRRAVLTQDVSAVTAACMMVEKRFFKELNGFDEYFAVAFNDVDFCLRVRDANHLVVYAPEAKLYHYESISRGYDSSGKNMRRFIEEQGKLRARWSKYYFNGDPYFGAASTLVSYVPSWFKH